ncbi:hypothetical protein PPYR_08334 [Photinus pyralis]|uniref:Uncharacterized protein n=1 Tax=Photinus pyralis TaxID=7054 RepID=A0A1Y1KAK9_PHOPY|nr:hypothetical protein PPYR_08334 [Photinus pyralis]
MTNYIYVIWLNKHNIIIIKHQDFQTCAIHYYDITTQECADQMREEESRLFYNTTHEAKYLLQIGLNEACDMCCCARVLKMAADQRVVSETFVRFIDCLEELMEALVVDVDQTIIQRLQNDTRGFESKNSDFELSKFGFPKYPFSAERLRKV